MDLYFKDCQTNLLLLSFGWNCFLNPRSFGYLLPSFRFGKTHWGPWALKASFEIKYSIPIRTKSKHKQKRRKIQKLEIKMKKMESEKKDKKEINPQRAAGTWAVKASFVIKNSSILLFLLLPLSGKGKREAKSCLFEHFKVTRQEKIIFSILWMRWMKGQEGRSLYKISWRSVLFQTW